MKFHNYNKNKHNISPERKEDTIKTMKTTATEKTTNTEDNITEVFCSKSAYTPASCTLLSPLLDYTMYTNNR